MILAFGGEALAQCGGGPVIVGPGPNCSISSTTTNDHLSGQAALLDAGSQFMQRFNALYSFRSGANAANNPQGGGADAGAEQRHRAWLEGYGQSSRTDAQNTFPGDRRRMWGVVAGGGVTFAPGVTVGVSVDQSRTKVDITNAAQDGRIDLTQFGAIASFERGPWNFGATLIHGIGRVHTHRLDAVGA